MVSFSGFTRVSSILGRRNDPITLRPVQTERPLLVYFPEGDATEPEHERATHLALARRLAEVADLPFGGCLDSVRQDLGYIFPVQTLVGNETANALGIRTEDDLFGGVVPHRFVGTKVITHPLVTPDAVTPEGWSEAFPVRVRDAVLPGFSAFSRRDAEQAATYLLQRGPVRIKPALARGGLGQVLVEDVRGLQTALASEGIDFASGVTLEENLRDVETCSVGQVRVAGLVASYYGTQHLTEDNNGALVYGGSDLLVVCGDFDALLNLSLDEPARIAVEQARIYDAAAMECFPGLLLSRRNYDVAQGRKPTGNWCSGVLEQSWRVGGASTAEIVALAAFRADPQLSTVRASAVEIYGQGAAVPENAVVFYHGSDNAVGPILKYAVVDEI